MGDYGMTADSGTFVESRGERHPTDLASLQGARLVVAQETEKGRRWNETRIKALTGGDTISARFMRQDPFEFKPVFKLLMSGNNKPRIGNIDEAIRRRLLLAPFTVTIPPAERDHQLADKLKTEHPAILRWCLDGCLEWQSIGLAPPSIVLDATNSYFADQDTLGQWLEECTHDAGLLAFTRIAELFASWKTWCETRNYKPGTTMGLSEMLTDRGFEKKRDGKAGHRGFVGLTVKTN
jgi:putative DNA primase/helicase